MSQTQERPTLYLSLPHVCNYLPGRDSTILFVDPQFPLAPRHFGELVRRGFRRSGDLVYRPHCGGCNACVPVRVPVAGFRASRAQRRVLARNADVEVRARSPEFDPEHYALYQRYQDARHPGSGMDDADPRQFLAFLVGKPAYTVFFEFRAAGRLLGVAVVDVLADAFSAVYTFYDPDEGPRSLGNFAVLWQLTEAARRGLSWVYLGYWIQDCRKMAYKTQFRPLEHYQRGVWVMPETENP